MIAITLNFKTLEAARQALLDIPASALVGSQEIEEAPKAAKPVKTPKAVAEAVAAPAPATAPPVEAPAPAAAPATSEPAVDYATLQKAVFALAGKSREAAASVAAGFGVKTFKELPAEQWAAALEAVTEKLAILEA